MTPFDQLSYLTLTFLLEKCDFSEPYAGIGFATEIKKEIEIALERKKRTHGKVNLYENT